MTEDRFKELEDKVKTLENDNEKLAGAVRHLTEAFMIMLDEEGPMVEEVVPPGAGCPSRLMNN